MEQALISGLARRSFVSLAAAFVPGAEKDEDGLRAPADRAFGARITLVGVRPT